MRNISIILIYTFLSVYTLKIHAAEVNYSLGSSVTSYDNVNLVRNPTKQEIATSLWGALTITENTANLRYDINSRLQSTDYMNNQADNENLGRLSATSTWIIKPGFFEWYLNDTFTQTTIDPYLANTPSNRQNANALSTGPNYYFRFNARNNLNLEARVENYDYAENIDSNRASGAARWIYRADSALNLSLNYEFLKAMFTDSENNNYNRQDTYIRADYHRHTNIFTMEVGGTRVNNENVEDFNNSRYMVSITNQRTRTTNIQLSYEHSLSDTGTELLDKGVFNVNNDTVETTSNDTYLSDSTRMTYSNQTSYGNFSIDALYSDRTYTRQIELDNIYKAATITNIWELHRASRLVLSARLSDTFYSNLSPTREDKDSTYEISYYYSARRNINIRTRIASIKRDSSIDAFSYEDTQYMIGLEYLSR